MLVIASCSTATAGSTASSTPPRHRRRSSAERLACLERDDVIVSGRLVSPRPLRVPTHRQGPRPVPGPDLTDGLRPVDDRRGPTRAARPPPLRPPHHPTLPAQLRRPRRPPRLDRHDHGDPRPLTPDDATAAPRDSVRYRRHEAFGSVRYRAGRSEARQRHRLTLDSSRSRILRRRSNVLVCDLRHFLDMPEDVPSPAVRLGLRLAAIVRAASARPAGSGTSSAIGCMRRPGRRRCDGFIMVFRRRQR